MSRSQLVTFYIDSPSEPQYSLLMAILRRTRASLVRDGRVHLYSQTDDGRDYVSRECSEENAYATVAKLFECAEIVALDAEVSHSGRTMLFNFDPCYDGQIVVTILGESVVLPDGMIDFNWYYSFWKDQMNGLVTITGIEFSIHL